MTGASEFLTENIENPEPEPIWNSNDYYDRQNAVSLAVQLMAQPNYAALLSSAILPNLEHISNNILNYIKYGKMVTETKE